MPKLYQNYKFKSIFTPIFSGIAQKTLYFFIFQLKFSLYLPIIHNFTIFLRRKKERQSLFFAGDKNGKAAKFPEPPFSLFYKNRPKQKAFRPALI